MFKHIMFKHIMFKHTVFKQMHNFKRHLSLLSKWQARGLKKLLHFSLAGAIGFAPLSSSFVATAYAQGQSIPIIRDAEIEQLLADYTAPIFRAAGLNANNIEIIIVNDQSYNAFVDGRRIFVNIGALMQSETPNELIGVLAHETGHLANGHQQRLREQLKRAQTMAIIGMLLGVGASVAGASTGNYEAAGAGGGIIAGSNEIALRSLLNYQRSEEASADRSAVSYLNKSQQSTKGMLTTFERFASSLNLSGARVDPYRLSHPLPRERIAALETLAKQSPYYNKKDPSNLQFRHDMARAKLAANLGRLSDLRRMFKDNPRGLPARYGDAIMALSRGSPKIAVGKARDLVNAEPNNPFFYELLGDALIKANDAQGAANAYQKSVQLDKKNSSLLRISYGRALLMTNSPNNIKTAINEIRSGLKREPEFASGYSYLAMAYGRSGQTALADLATADMHYYNGNAIQARIFATRAKKSLKRGSQDWLRAQDILTATQSK